MNEETTKYIFGRSDIVDGIEIFPVKMKDYDAFMENAGVLTFRLENFPEEYQREYKLLDLLTYGAGEDIHRNLVNILSLVLKKEVSFMAMDENPKEYAYIADENSIINRDNFDEIRKIIMRQNLIYERKIYKDPLLAKWADKVLESRRKKSVKITIEDMITTVVANGKTFEDVEEMTIYQMNSLFQRVSKIESYRTSVSFKCAGEKVNIEHFAEYIDMFRNPYDDVFVKSGQLNELNSVLK